MSRRAYPSFAVAGILVLLLGAVAAAPPPATSGVGDADSFGRSVRWLGVAANGVDLKLDCTGDTSPCQMLTAAPGLTTFNFPDIAHISLPAHASNSLLCYWFSPFLTTTYDNSTAASVVAQLNYSPTVTVENPVLNDPALIDPTTGLSFGGRLTAGMTSLTHHQIPLPAGLRFTEVSRDSAVCIAGLVSRQDLVQNWGLSDTQARDFFRQPMTLRLNIQGSAQFVDDASLYFGLRIVGD